MCMLGCPLMSVKTPLQTYIRKHSCTRADTGTQGGLHGCTCRMPFSGKSKAADVPPVPSIQLTMVCRASSWL